MEEFSLFFSIMMFLLGANIHYSTPIAQKIHLGARLAYL